MRVPAAAAQRERIRAGHLRLHQQRRPPVPAIRLQSATRCDRARLRAPARHPLRRGGRGIARKHGVEQVERVRQRRGASSRSLCSASDAATQVVLRAVFVGAALHLLRDLSTSARPGASGSIARAAASELLRFVLFARKRRGLRVGDEPLHDRAHALRRNGVVGIEREDGAIRIGRVVVLRADQVAARKLIERFRGELLERARDGSPARADRARAGRRRERSE